MQSSEELKGTPRKVLIDGQLYILNGGNTYNLQGMEVKKSKSKVQPNNLQTKTEHQH